MYARAAKQYKSTYIQSASPVRLIEEMYRRLFQDIEEARVGIQTKDAKRRGEALKHALQIVAALHRALDRRMAPDICAQLGSLYVFITGRLTQANVHNDVKALDEALKIASHLLETFQMAAQQAGMQ